jgi:Protein of unknown function (DUF3187)
MKTLTEIYLRLFILLIISIILSNNALADEFAPDPYWQGTLGPMTIRSLSPAQSLRLAPLPRSPYGLPQGQTEIQFNVAFASVFIEEPGRFLMDFHFTDTRFAINHGFANNWSAEISLNDRRIVNAHLDQITEDFHDLFGIEQNGRSEVEKNDTHIFIPEYGIDLGKESRGQYSQTIGLSIQKVLIDKSVAWPALAVNINMSYETLSDGMIEQGKFDYGVQFSAAQKQRNGYAYGNISYTHFGSDNVLGMPLENQQFSGMMGYEFTVEEDQSFLLQYLFSEGVVKNLGALEDYSHEIHIGYKWRTQSYLWELGIVENIINFDNSADIAFTFGVTYKI